MAITTNVPSSNFEDLQRDVQDATRFANATAPFTNRVGQSITPISMRDAQLASKVAEAASAVEALGWFPADGSFTDGGTITARNQVLFNDADSSFYSWSGALPKVVPAASTPASTGGVSANAWVNRGDAALRSALAAPGSTALIAGMMAGAVIKRLKSSGNVLDYIPESEWDAIKNATSTYDATADIQSAFDECRSVYFPVGLYWISDTIRVAANAAGRQLVGENMIWSVVRCKPSMTNKPMFWFGNSSGHGNPYGIVENIHLDGGGRTSQSNIGIRWHEGGTSVTRDFYMENLGTAIQALGSIHNRIEGNGFIITCYKGVEFTYIGAGIPSGPDDITTTGSNLSLNGNMSKIVNLWITDCVETAVYIRGGLMQIEGCTFQASTNSGAHPALLIEDANESFDYGGGPSVRDCWFEGGNLTYAIEVRNTNGVVIEHNFITGAFGITATHEGGVLLDNAKNATVKRNAFWGAFIKNVQGGRLSQAAVYVKPNCGSFLDIDDNYIAPSMPGCIYYYEGKPNPTVHRTRQVGGYAYVTVEDGVATLQTDLNVLSISRVGIGDYTIEWAYNRQTDKMPVSVAVFSNSITVPIYATLLNTQSQSSYRVFFTDKDGNPIDPPAFSVEMKGYGVSGLG